jgi:hypothetical protein
MLVAKRTRGKKDRSVSNLQEKKLQKPGYVSKKKARLDEQKERKCLYEEFRIHEKVSITTTRRIASHPLPRSISTTTTTTRSSRSFICRIPRRRRARVSWYTHERWYWRNTPSSHRRRRGVGISIRIVFFVFASWCQERVFHFPNRSFRTDGELEVFPLFVKKRECQGSFNRKMSGENVR